MGGIVGGIVGGIGQVAAAKAQAKAAQRAAELSLTGYNYLTSGPGAGFSQSLINTGQNALGMRAALLGVPTGSQGEAPASQARVGHVLGGFSFGGGQSPQSGQPSTGGPNGSTLSTAQSGLDNYLNSTGYQFQLGEGMNAINTNAATRGLLNSGGTLKATQKFGQDLASTTFNNYLSQLGGLSHAGQNMLGQIGSVGSTAGGGAANATLAGGNAQAGGIVGLTSSIGNALAGMGGGFGGGSPGAYRIAQGGPGGLY